MADCPKCGTPNMYDNRGNKRNPRSPDMKCRNKECGHGVWDTPKPNGNAGPSFTRTGVSTGAPYNWNALGLTYKRCFTIAGKVVGDDSPDRVAAAATIFIAATKLGLTTETPKPAPPPPPPPPPPVEDYDPSLVGGQDDDDY